MASGNAKETPNRSDLLTLEIEVSALRKEVAHLNSHRFVRIHNSIPRLLAFSFIRGLALGLGTIIGATLLLSVVAWSISQIEFLPIVGEWAAEIAHQMRQAAEGSGN